MSVSSRRASVGRSQSVRRDWSLLSTTAIVLLTLAGWAIRVDRLGALSLWVDEGYSYEIARRGPAAILALLAGEDRHPPLHYVLLWAAQQIFGTSEFSLRYVSAAAGTLAIPLLARLGQRLGGQSVGLGAAALLILAPFHVWYSQEARMYALLMACGLLGVLAFMRLLDRGDRTSTALVAAATAGALYSHYYGILLLPAYLALVATRPIRSPGRVVVALLGAGILFLPWLPALVSQAGRAAGGYRLDASPFAVILDLISAFALGDSFPVAKAALATFISLAVLGLGATGVERTEPGRARLAGVVLAVWLLSGPTIAYAASALLGLELRANGRMYYLGALPPFLLLVARGAAIAGDLVAEAGQRATIYRLGGRTGQLAATRRSGANARFAPASTGRSIAGGTADGVRRRGRHWRFVSLAVMLVLTLGLSATQGEALRRQIAGRPKEDFRGAARLIESRLWPGDSILVVDEPIFRDQPFAYYLGGRVPIRRVGIENPSIEAALSDLPSRGRAWLVQVHGEIADPAGRTASWLDRDRTPIDDIVVPGVHLRLYALEPRLVQQAPSIGRPIGVQLGGAVDLVAADLPAEAIGGQSARITLVWRPERTLERPYHAALFLLDGQGRVWAQTDRVAMSPFHDPTRWRPGEYLTDRYDLPLPAGLLPGQYRLRLKLYDVESGQALAAPAGDDSVEVGTIPIEPTLAPLGRPGTDLGGLTLIESSVAPRARPGDALAVELVGQVTRRLVDAPRFELRGPSAVPVVRAAEIPPELAPPRTWRPGQIVRLRAAIPIPPRLPPGTYAVNVAIEHGQPIGQVRIEPLPRQRDLPPPAHRLDVRFDAVADLLGYDLSAEVLSAGAALRLKLLWRAASEPDRDYTVFVHVIDSAGRIRVQRDNQPRFGTYPTTYWERGELVEDEYTLAMPFDLPDGVYQILVGMYEPTTGVRLPSAAGSAVALPTALRIAASS